MYIKLLYKNFMVSINQKSIIDTHTKRKRNSKITLKRAIKSGEIKKQKEKKKKGHKQLKYWHKVKC